MPTETSTKEKAADDDSFVTKADLKSAIDELTIIIGNSFTRFEDSMNNKFDGVNNRIQGLWNAFDSHTLDCVSRDEHNKLEKRVRILENA
ncbi:MAG: hypothetical protein P4L61_03590 [Candidatus Pacebacteria bacterium]|nr:hypothetical protein [Candidatus Paceibacterota bacterium]